ncbi:MAG: 30S ribosomal protein S6 [Phycisphaeraceae bacterium]|nr:30S ribosomal protein S6 [Phycisphaeraceae bacterium]
MADNAKRAYEGMFLASQQQASDFAGLVTHVRQLLSRANADVVALQKWDERRLAYEIDKQRRGVYLLAYFMAQPSSIAGLERDCNISEQLMRAIFLSAEHLSEDEMRAHDRSQDLDTEARLRAERAAQRTEVATARVEESTDEEPAEAEVTEN